MKIRSQVALLLLWLAAAVAPVTAQKIALEHGWEFLPDREASWTAENAGNAPGWRAVRVGVSWNAQFEDMRDYMGVAWYRATVQAPDFALGQSPGAPAKRVLLRFGAVDCLAEVFVNGTKAGEHEGGYTPFVFDVTDQVKPGPNQVLVRVLDPPMDEKENTARFPQYLYNEIPHGKQNWYVQTGGLWQPVWVEFRPARYVERVQITPKINGEVSLTVQYGGKSEMNPNPTEVVVYGPTGAMEFKTGGGGMEVSDQRTFTGRVQKPQLWGPENPALYTAEVTIGGETVRERFGFRTFEARDGKFFLNGEPFYLISALDQDFYPDTLYTPPSREYVRDMMLKGKALGLNLLRCHIKVCDPQYLDAADEVGMLVWYEIPSWNDSNHFAPVAAERGEKIFREMVQRDWNRPSIVIQSVINEAWGTAIAKKENASQRKWLREAFERAKELTAPLGRLIVDNSPCCDNFHVKTDINDFHQYFSIPDNAERWDKWTADFASRPKWTFSPYGEATSTGREPLVVSEFGNWGLPQLPEQLPWWFDRDFAGREVTRPAGVLERFQQYGFGRLFQDFNDLARETQWHQFLSLKHEIEEIRGHGSIQGYTITEFTDINWEVNGLMDMWRRPKVYAAELAKIQQQDVVLARLPRRNFWAGERVRLETVVSHYSSRLITGARLTWWTDSGAFGRVATLARVPQGSVVAQPPITLTLPMVLRPTRERLHLELRSGNGELLAQNDYELFVYPRAEARGVRVRPHELPVGMAGALASGGGQAPGGRRARRRAPVGPEVMVAPRLDNTVRAHLESGGRAIILLNTEDGLPQGAPKLVPRKDDLDGNWVTNFNWARTNAAPFQAVPFQRVLGWEAAQVTHRFLLQGLKPEQWDDVLSGTFYGWLNWNSATTVQAKVGQGKAIITTLRLDDYGRDPYATLLLDAMVRYAATAAFAPRLELEAP